MAEHLFAKCMIPVKSAMKEADIPLDEINDIVMVGGSSRMPRLKVILNEYFGEAININDEKHMKFFVEVARRPFRRKRFEACSLHHAIGMLFPPCAAVWVPI